MRIVIYVGVAALIIWAVVYLFRHTWGQLKGECGISCNKTACKKCNYREINWKKQRKDKKKVWLTILGKKIDKL